MKFQDLKHFDIIEFGDVGDFFVRILPCDSSPLNHHLGEYVFIFIPTTLRKSKYDLLLS